MKLFYFICGIILLSFVFIKLFHLEAIGLIFLGILFAITIIGIIYSIYNLFIQNELSGKSAKYYIIRKGHHFCNKFFQIEFGRLKHNVTKIFKREFIFEESCYYTFDTGDIYDKNKLFGFSLGLFNNCHKNSFRFGWNCENENGRIQIYAYQYINKIRDVVYLCNIIPGHIYDYVIIINDNKITYQIFEKINKNYLKRVEYTQEFQIKKNIWYWLCKPYFGGTSKAPHKMTIIG